MIRFLRLRKRYFGPFLEKKEKKSLEFIIFFKVKLNGETTETLPTSSPLVKDTLYKIRRESAARSSSSLGLDSPFGRNMGFGVTTRRGSSPRLRELVIRMCVSRVASAFSCALRRRKRGRRRGSRAGTGEGERKRRRGKGDVNKNEEERSD